MTESEIMKSVQLEASRMGARLFRNNVGQGWIGKPEIPTSNMSTFLRPGDVVLRNARPLHAGLCVGSSDLIGWHPLIITREMIGQLVAVFAGIEIKTEVGRISMQQGNFLAAVTAAGGTGGVCRSSDELKKIFLRGEKCQD